MSTTLHLHSESNLSGIQGAGLVLGSVPTGVKNPLWMGLPSRLRSLDAQTELSWAALSESSGVNAGGIALVAKGRVVPRPETVERLACALGVSPVWLAFGEEGEEPWANRVERKGHPKELSPSPCLGNSTITDGHKGIAERLKCAREASGLSLRAVAKLSDLSAQALSKAEAGVTAPLISNVEAIAKALGVAPGWLAFGLGRGPDGKKTKARAVA